MKPSELLSGPEKWTKGFYAKDKNLKHVSHISEDAFCFCIIGAIMHCDPERADHAHDASKVMDKIVEKRFSQRLNRATDIVVQFNDHPDTKYEEVISVLQEAGL